MRNFKKNILTPGMIAAFVIGVALLIYGNISTIKEGKFFQYLELSNSVSFFDMSYGMSGFALFVPVLAVLPAATILCIEFKSGYIKYIFMRESRNKYIFLSLISNSIAGGIGTSLSGILLALTAQFSNPFTQEMKDAGYSTSLSFGWMEKYETMLNGNMALIIYIGTLFLFGMVWSTYALCFAILFKNIYVTLASSFLTCFSFHVFFNQLHWDKLSPINMIGADCSDIESGVYVLIYQLILLIVFSMVFIVVAKRRTRNV